tara:strand:- start:972 stop:1217 length:246 start_codon:yes stop_codon:yes gene_type:complete
MLVGFISAIVLGLLFFFKGLIVEKWKNLDDGLKKKIKIISVVVVLIFLTIITILNPMNLLFSGAVVVLYFFYWASERLLKD